MLTLEKYAQITGIPLRTLRRLYVSGKLPYKGERIGRRIVIYCDLDPDRLRTLEKKIDDLIHWIAKGNGNGSQR